MIRQRRFFPCLVALLVAFLGLLLFPKIGVAQEDLAFEVTPRRICKGETVQVRWMEAEDRGVLLTEPEVPGAGNVGEEGSLQPTLRDTTRFRMLAIAGDDTTRSVQEVAVFSDGQRKSIVFSLRAIGDSAVGASERLRTDVWSSKIRLGTLAGHAGRPVTVRHAGRETVLAADSTPSNSFQGLPVRGDWEVRAPLLPGEELGNPDKAPPTRLYLLATLICAP